MKKNKEWHNESSYSNKWKVACDDRNCNERRRTKIKELVHEVIKDRLDGKSIVKEIYVKIKFTM